MYSGIPSLLNQSQTSSADHAATLFILAREQCRGSGGPQTRGKVNQDVWRSTGQLLVHTSFGTWRFLSIEWGHPEGPQQAAGSLGVRASR